MNYNPKVSEISLLKFKLLVSNYEKHILEEENNIFRDELDYLADTEIQLREKIHQQYKIITDSNINHFNSSLK